MSCLNVIQIISWHIYKSCFFIFGFLIHLKIMFQWGQKINFIFLHSNNQKYLSFCPFTLTRNDTSGIRHVHVTMSLSLCHQEFCNYYAFASLDVRPELQPPLFQAPAVIPPGVNQLGSCHWFLRFHEKKVVLIGISQEVWTMKGSSVNTVGCFIFPPVAYLLFLLLCLSMIFFFNALMRNQVQGLV